MESANILRKDKRLISFTTIPNSLLRNESLSLRARGLLSLMLSYSENWVFYKSHLQKVACLGRDAFDSVWKELIEAKHLKVFQNRNADGSFGQHNILVFIEPTEITEEELKSQYPESKKPPESVGISATQPVPEKPYTGNPETVNPHLRNNKGKNTNIKNTNVKKNFIKKSSVEKSKKPKTVSLEELSVEHVSEWLSEKRMRGEFFHIDEKEVLETFKDYCRANGKQYKDYVAAYRNAFSWSRFKQKPNKISRDDALEHAFREGLRKTIPGQGGIRDIFELE